MPPEGQPDRSSRPPGHVRGTSKSGCRERNPPGFHGYVEERALAVRPGTGRDQEDLLVGASRKQIANPPLNKARNAGVGEDLVDEPFERGAFGSCFVPD